MNDKSNSNTDHPESDQSRTLSEKASLDIEAYIEEQSLAPGSKIPSERVKEGDRAGARRHMEAHIGYTATSSRLYG